MKRAFFLVPLALSVPVALAFACSDAGFASYCTGIPSGGCPSDDPDTCPHDAGPDANPGDPSCAAIYSHSSDCVWTLVQTCPNYVAPKDAGPKDASDADIDAHLVLRDAGFTLPEGAAGGPDCGELESPDCPLALAVGCGPSCCDCEQLWVCSGGGWNIWGNCADGGALVPTKP